MKKMIMIVGCILAVLAAGIYYYITLPAINIHSVGFWWFIISILGVIFLWRLIRVNFSNFLCRKIWGARGVTWTLKSQAEFDIAVAEDWIPIFEGFRP